jgi:hypothetical protein
MTETERQEMRFVRAEQKKSPALQELRGADAHEIAASQAPTEIGAECDKDA